MILFSTYPVSSLGCVVAGFDGLKKELRDLAIDIAVDFCDADEARVDTVGVCFLQIPVQFVLHAPLVVFRWPGPELFFENYYEFLRCELVKFRVFSPVYKHDDIDIIFSDIDKRHLRT